MKLKFINLLLASVLLIGSAQVFTSCKDNESDLWNDLHATDVTLRQDLAQAQSNLNGLTQSLQTVRDNLNDSIQKNLDAINEMRDGNKEGSIQSQIDKITSEMTTLAVVESAIKTAVDTLPKAQDIAEINRQLGLLQSKLESVDLDSLNQFMHDWRDKLPGVLADATAAKTKAEKNEAEINAAKLLIDTLSINHEKDVKELKESIAKLDTTLRAVAEDYYKQACAYSDTLFAKVPGLIDTKVSELKKAIDENAKQIGLNTKAIEQLQKDVKALNDRLSEVEKQINNVLGRVSALENRVSGIVLQGTYNPIIGYFATPLGVNSNILMAYTGHYEGNSINFPCTVSGVEYDGTPVLTAADLKIVNPTKVRVENNTNLIEPGDGNLGTIYFTVNPANIDLEGKTFALVNSLGQESVVELRNVRPCNEEMTFGYSRAETGFYMADATLTQTSNLSSVAITIDESLKSAVYDVYKNRNKGSLVELARGLYHQVDGILPALAINTTWAENGKTQVVTSQYGVAAATAQPLSFTTLQGKSIRHIPFPTIDSERFHVNLTADGINIELPDSLFNIAIDLDQLREIKLDLNLQMQCHLNQLGEISVTVNGKVNDVPDGGYVAADGSLVFDKYKPVNFTATGNADLENFRKDLNEQLTREFKKNSDALNEEVERAFAAAMGKIADTLSENIAGAVKKSVDNMLSSIETQIDESLEDVIADLNGQINGKIDKLFNRLQNNRFYDKLQTAVNKVNNILDDPNHYLQSILVFKAGDQVGFVSGAIDAPTVCKLGAGNALTLVATTYNAELATPAYMKYVAVTNVYKAGDKKVNAVAGDANCLKVLKDANSHSNLNKVVYGQRNAYALKLTKGYEYQITYQALDYHGRTSTHKYYVRVK